MWRLTNFVTIIIVLKCFHESKQNKFDADDDNVNNSTSDIIKTNYKQCRSANELCSVNNDCCSNCCVTFTYTSMTCQLECPDEELGKNNHRNSPGNVIWKEKNNASVRNKLKTSPEKTTKKDALVYKTSERINRISSNVQTKNNTHIGQSIENNGKDNDMLGESIQYTNKERSLEIAEVIIRKIENKPNKDIGTPILDLKKDGTSKETINSETVAQKKHENVEIGLSVLNLTYGGNNDDAIDESNENQQVGGPVLKIRGTPQDTAGQTQKNREDIVSKSIANIQKIGHSVFNRTKFGTKEVSDESIENQEVGVPVMKIGATGKEKETQIKRENATNGSERALNNKEIGQSVVRLASRRHRVNPNEQIEDENMDNSKTSKPVSKTNEGIRDIVIKSTSGNEEKYPSVDAVEKDSEVDADKRGAHHKMTVEGKSISVIKQKTETVLRRNQSLDVINVTDTFVDCVNNTCPETSIDKPCGDNCDPTTTIVEVIKDIVTNKLSNLNFFNMSESSATQTPVCKTIGSSCTEATECCTQCCAVFDGLFQCFDRGTDECQSSLPGNKDHKCKKSGETCETHLQCCSNVCTDCGTSFKCDNENDNVCRVLGVQGRLQSTTHNSKFCKRLGDTCARASDCCTQCCAVSDGVFKCFEEDTHECQTSDNLGNQTLSETPSN